MKPHSHIVVTLVGVESSHLHPSLVLPPRHPEQELRQKHQQSFPPQLLARLQAQGSLPYKVLTVFSATTLDAICGFQWEPVCCFKRKLVFLTILNFSPMLSMANKTPCMWTLSACGCESLAVFVQKVLLRVKCKETTRSCTMCPT